MINYIISLIDYPNKLKILKFFKKNLNNNSLNIMTESSSSTFNSIDQNTSYYKRKKKLFSIFLRGKNFLKKKTEN